MSGSGLRRWSDRPVTVMILSLLLTSGFVSARLATLDWDASRFVLAGEGLSDPARVPEDLFVLRGSTGYDGQAFYRLALDPLTDRRVANGITLDTPSYRQQRIGYPGLAWVASGGGDPERVSWALIVINVIAMGAVGFAGGALSIAIGRHAMWGAVFALYPGFIVSVGRDLSEPLAAAFMFGGLVLLRRSRATWAALALAAAILTRETTAVVPIGLLIAWLVARLRSRPSRPMREFVVPLGVFAAWQLFLYARWDSVAVFANPNATDPPFVGLVDQLRRYVSLGSTDAVLSLVEIALLAALLVTALVAIRSRHVAPHERWAFVVASIGAALLDHSVWHDHAHYLRALTEFSLLGALVVLAGTRTDPVRLAIPFVGLWGTLFAIFARNL